MSDLFASLPSIGDLYYHHIYLFYDEPQVFSCMTKTLQPYFLIAIPDDDANNEIDVCSTWLAAPISTGRLLKAEKNAIEIREIFTKPEALLWKIIWNNDRYVVNTIDPQSLTDEMLPETGALLDYVEAMEIVPSAEAPVDRAAQEMRDILEISLEKDDAHTSEVSCSTLGDTLNNIQQLVYALAYKDGGLRGTIPKKIKEDCTLCVSGMFAASVGIRLKSNDFCDIYRETPLTATLNDFNELFSVAGNKESLRSFLSTHNPRVAVKYRTLLRSLLSNKVGLRINNASPNNRAFAKHFSTKELFYNLELVNSEIEEMVEYITAYGNLVGANVERCSFELITTDNETIRGTISSALGGNIFSIPQTVEADIEIRIGSDSMTREEKLLYTLTAIRPIVQEAKDTICD